MNQLLSLAEVLIKFILDVEEGLFESVKSRLVDLFDPKEHQEASEEFKAEAVSLSYDPVDLVWAHFELGLPSLFQMRLQQSREHAIQV